MDQSKKERVTAKELKAIMPFSEGRIDTYAEFLNMAMEEFEINTMNRVAFFLAQLAHESGELRYVEEIASGKAYENRLDLGNDQEGDGVKYKGHGLIQITGKANHFACADYFGVDKQVICEWLMFPKGACMSAGWFWNSRNLNAVADKDDFELCTRRINGGLNGFDARKEYLRRARAVLHA